MLKPYYLIAFSLLFSNLTPSMAQSRPDQSFGNKGIVLTDIGSVGSIAQTMIVQSDGKIIAGGYTSNNGLDYDFALVRYQADGSLDYTFGNAGKAVTAVMEGSDFGKSIAIQNDGKILLAGYSSNGQNADFTIVRYHHNGILDLSFGKNGITITDIGNFNDYAKSIALQTDGKIVVSGQTFNGNDYDFATIRYTADGSLDRSFANNGIAITDLGSNDNSETLAIDFFGNILIAGYSFIDSNKDFAMLRYLSNGTLDLKFNAGGKVCMDIDRADNTANAILLQPDGKILLSGYSNNEKNIGLALLRFHKIGKLDYEFGDNGKIISALTEDGIKGTSLALQNDGKILVGGYRHNSKDYDFAILRYNEDGSADEYFSEKGEQVFAIQSSNDYCYAIGVQQDGKIIAAGSASIASKEKIAIARFITSTEMAFSEP
jgi:uncharacterized delta-60 repeat protein